jgi:uroporphyrinogen III methyltransferase/synthase
MVENIGRVYLVGGGPGNPELITVRGQRLLQTCDAVVYDRLLADELIVLLPEHVEKHYVGKQPGRHSMSQHEINQLLVQLAHAGKRVVRLKGGDPFIFGCGSIEGAFLRDNGVEFEIVPGVTSGIAGPAYAGIPCTDRHHASFVILATGHAAADKQKPSVDWETLGKAGNGTLVLYMGVENIAANIERLIAGGMSPQQPAAIVRRATFTDQQCWTGTLEKLPAMIDQHDIKPPVVFVIGNVVELHAELDWLRGMPLLGKRIMVTRPAAQAEHVYQSLRDLGAGVLPYPTIKITEHDDAEGWRQFSFIANPHRWLVFTSENGVRFFISQYLDRYGDIRRLADFRIAAVGSGTARALADYHLRADFMPSAATVQALTGEFVSEQELHETTVIRVRGDLADDTFEQGMQRMQVECIPLTVYRTETAIWAPGLKGKLLEQPPDAIMFSSGSTIQGLLENLPQNVLDQLLEDCVVAAIGPATAKKLEQAGITVTLQSEEHTIPGLIRTLVDYFVDQDRKR